jgi:hypothetical protein
MSEAVLVTLFGAAITLLVTIIGAWATLASTGRKLPLTLQLTGLFAIVCALVLGLQLFPRSPAPTSLPISEPTKDSRSPVSLSITPASSGLSRPTAEQIARDYFSLLNQGHDDESQYRVTWKMLSERFITAQARRGGYDGYVGFWKSIATPLQIANVEISEQNDRATGFVKLIHLTYPANDQTHEYYVELVWEKQQSQWLLDFSCESPYEEGCPKR